MPPPAHPTHSHQHNEHPVAPNASSTSLYRGRTIAFGTMHGKQHQVLAAFASILGAHVHAPPGLDTDQFGTFTGDVTRTLTPIEAARAKAHLATEALGVATGLASEASYGPIPGLPVAGHQELLLFIDDELGIDVLEGEQAVLTLPAPRRATTLADIEPDLARYEFPTQALVVRPAAGPARYLRKGIQTHQNLANAILAAAAQSEDDHALVEADLRAHHNPERRLVLTRLGERLARRLATRCPGCGCPGYGRTSTVAGQECSACGAPTHLIRADVHTCPRCPTTHTQARPPTLADPKWCDYCNP